MNFPPLDFGGSGKPVYFLHANGYPPACYLPLITNLSERYRIFAMEQRPLWLGSHPEEIEDWFPLTDDLLKLLDRHTQEPVICIGHSMGGIALLRAALLEPDRFIAIVLIDPVLFPPSIIRLWQIVHSLKMESNLHPLVPATRNRRQAFDDLNRLFNGYRHKAIFKFMDDQSLHAYIEGIACPSVSGYQLCYSAEWESRIYVTSVWHDMDIWRRLPNLKPPTLILRGGETDTFWSLTGRLVRRKQPNIQIEEVENSTHLLPLERPLEVSNRIFSFLEDLK